MSSFWRKGNREGGKRTWGGRFSISLLSLFLSLLPACLHAGPYADLDARLQGRSDAEAVKGLRKLVGDDSDAQSALDDGPAASRAYVALRASLEGAPPVKAPPIGPGPGDERRASSWLQQALDRFHTPSFDAPETTRPHFAIGSWATTLMWIVLGGLGGLAVFLLARYARLPGLRRRVKPIVEEDEAPRSADAWLEEANALIAQGRFREAVRGLYVAGLMRFDEAGVARFDRHQTNWEHLRRIEASPKKPAGADVRDATGRFDRVWYGHLDATAEDASAMRAWYDTLVRRLAEASPA